MSRGLEEAFVRASLRYRIIGGTRFYERKEIRDLIAYLRVIHNPFDSVSLLRVLNVPGRGLGAKTIDELAAWAATLGLPLYTALQLLAEQEAGNDESGRPRHHFAPRAVTSLLRFLELIAGLADHARVHFVPALIDAVLERTEYLDYLTRLDERGEERIENVKALRGQAEKYVGLQPDAGLGEFLEDVTLVSDADEIDERLDAVTLITLHTAKGLEFPCVFMVGMEDGVLPHQRSFDDEKQMEEERRLAYVGLTRAKDRLYLTRAFRRTLFGSGATNPASRFLKAIPADLTAHAARPDLAGRLVDTRVPAPTTRRYDPPATPVPSLPSFADGDRVRHAKFGEGVVVSTKESGSDVEVTVAFPGAGVKRLMLSFAALEKLA